MKKKFLEFARQTSQTRRDTHMAESADFYGGGIISVTRAVAVAVAVAVEQRLRHPR
jgi:hypothetical protein